MAKRSPILGFNHNFRHRGLVFHVQTEDSGVDNPHIFTHLFNGGVVLSTRKLTYDPGAAHEVVKALMQAQHKAMLKGLKRGDFDAKIDQYFGDDPNLEATTTLQDPAGATEPSVEIPLGADRGTEDLELELELGDIEVVESDAVSKEIEVITSVIGDVDGGIFGEDEHREGDRPNPFSALALDDVSLSGKPTDTLRGPAPPAAVGETPSGAVLIHAAAPDSAPLPPGAKPTRPGQYQYAKTGKIQTLEGDPIRDADAPAPPRVSSQQAQGKTAGRPRTATVPLQSEPDTVDRKGARPASVVVEKPSVIVGAPTRVIGQPPAERPEPARQQAARPQAARAQPARRAREQGASSLFGKDLISEKSLDEVILAYLSEDGSDRE